jgi:hypothetical protein
MKQSWWVRAIGLIIITSMFSLVLAAKTGDPKDLLLKRLKEQFVPTVFDQDGAEIVAAGTIVALQEDGLLVYGFPAPNAIFPISHYKNGVIFQDRNMIYQGGLDCMVFGDSSNACAANASGESYSLRQKTLKAGDKLWIGHIAIRKKEIAVVVVTDPYDDGRYIGELWIPFKNDILPAPDEAIKLVSQALEAHAAQVLTAEPEPVATPPPIPVPPARQYDELAPPPAPPAPAPTITIGELKAQVLTDFGEPQRKAATGPKEIFFYTELKLKVTFINGIVSSID